MFVARPHTGMGVAKAGEDAVALADALAADGDIDRALAAWEVGRLAYGRSAVARGLRLGRMLSSDRTADDGDTFGLGRGVHQAVMIETAVPGDIRA